MKENMGAAEVILTVDEVNALDNALNNLKCLQSLQVQKSQNNKFKLVNSFIY